VCCRCVAGELQVSYSELQVCCRCVAGVLQVCCRCVAGVLQMCCRCVAGVLQVCCRCALPKSSEPSPDPDTESFPEEWAVKNDQRSVFISIDYILYMK